MLWVSEWVRGKKVSKTSKIKVQKHPFFTALFISLFSALTCSLKLYVSVWVCLAQIVNKKGSGYETNKPRHPIQSTHSSPYVYE